VRKFWFLILDHRRQKQYNHSQPMAVTWELQEDGRYMCLYCRERTYKRKSGVLQHLKYECGVEPNFKCDLCHKKFSYKTQMKSHMINLHKRLPTNKWNTLCELFTYRHTHTFYTVYLNNWLNVINLRCILFFYI